MMTPQEHATVNRTVRISCKMWAWGSAKSRWPRSWPAGIRRPPGGRRVGGGSARPKQGHFAPKAKASIHLFMAGGPSHLDLFDHKPDLAKFEGKSIPPEVIAGQRYAFIRPMRRRSGRV